MNGFDPRRTAAREDLAASFLRDRIRAPRYSDGERRQISAPSAPLRMYPRFDAPLLTEALSGELFTAYDIQGGWAWGQLAGDGYVGFTTIDNLTTQIEQPTHKVSARATFVYPAPDIKRPPFMRLSFSSEVIVEAARKAHVEAGRRCAEALQPLIGDSEASTVLRSFLPEEEHRDEFGPTTY